MRPASKISAIFIYYSLASLAFAFICNLFFKTLGLTSINTITFCLLFTVILINRLWRHVYSYPFHYYLSKLFLKMTKWVVISALFAMVLTYAVIAIEKKELFIPKNPIIYALFPLGTMLFITLCHLVQFLWIKHLGNLGYFHRKVLVVGKPCDNFDYDHHFDDIWDSREFSGNLIKKDQSWQISEHGKNFKEVESYKDLIYTRNIGEVFFFVNPDFTTENIEPIKEFLKENSIPYTVYPTGEKIKSMGWGNTFNILPYIDRFNVKRDSLKAITFKRILSILIALFGIVAGLPLWILLSLIIKLYDKGPVFYVSKRVGKNGKEFDFYKFRTMVMNADKLKDKLMDQNQRKDGPLFKMENDPRVTPVGRFLRKFSLDEFPQLINIIRGEMCFIGPRPHLPKEVEHYTSRDCLRLECIPGLSCLPQIKDRNNIGFREWVELDLLYRKKWSIFLDFKIFIKTIGVALEPLFNKNGGN